MSRASLALIAALAPALVLPMSASAEQGPAEAVVRALGQRVVTACQEELTRHCASVTPGEGRLLACLVAHQDKLSGRCDYALYDSAMQLDRAVAAITHVASECQADIKTHCAKVEMGEGRIARCLEAAGDKLSANCNRAMHDTGLR